MNEQPTKKPETLDEILDSPEARCLLDGDPKLKAACLSLIAELKQCETDQSIRMKMRADYCLVALIPSLPDNATQKEKDDWHIRQDIAKDIGGMYRASINFAVAELISNCVELLERSVGGPAGMIELYQREPSIRIFVETLKKAGRACLKSHDEVNVKGGQILNLIHALENSHLNPKEPAK